MLAAEWERVGKSQALSCLDAERYVFAEGRVRRSACKLTMVHIFLEDTS